MAAYYNHFNQSEKVTIKSHLLRRQQFSSYLHNFITIIACFVILLTLVLNFRSISYIFDSMDILHNNALINEIVDKLFKHRRTDYSQFALQHSLSLTDIEHEILRVPNQKYQIIYASLFKKSKHPDICILFMHGYGSNRLQCANILKVLPEQYALCSFDFSGSGKSEGDLITYGMKEKQDINSMIVHLRQAGYKRFILWGRSMGATSALLYSLRYKPQDVLLQVVDSPFYSFEMIAFEIAGKNVKAPEFVISFALQLAKKNCAKFQYNPFGIELSNVGECQVPALFLYCEEDSVINCQNTHLISSKYRAVFQKLAIPQNHNTVRTQGTLEKVFAYIEKYSKKPKQRVIQEINQQYFQCRPSHARIDSAPSRKMHCKGEKSLDQSSDHKGSLRKGIQRVNVESSKKYDDYGIWVTSQMAETPSSIKRKSGSAKRPHLSLSSSFASKNIREIESVLSPSFQHELTKEYSSVLQFTAKTSASQKQRGCKKISTVKSMRANHGLNNSKYL